MAIVIFIVIVALLSSSVSRKRNQIEGGPTKQPPTTNQPTNDQQQPTKQPSTKTALWRRSNQPTTSRFLGLFTSAGCLPPTSRCHRHHHQSSILSLALFFGVLYESQCNTFYISVLSAGNKMINWTSRILWLWAISHFNILHECCQLESTIVVDVGNNNIISYSLWMLPAVAPLWSFSRCLVQVTDPMVSMWLSF